MPLFESLVSASRVPMMREAETEAYAVDHRVPHRRQIDLSHHLPGTGAEAPADTNKTWIDLSHAGRGIERHRKETGDRANRDLRSRPNPEPHNHNREEDDLRCWTQVVKVRLKSPGQEPIAAEQQADREAGRPADRERCGDLRGSDAEIEVVIGIRKQPYQSAAYRQQRRHDVAIQPAGMQREIPMLPTPPG